MTSVLFGMLFVVVVAIAVVAMVAYPHLREGSPVLTPEGERLARASTAKARALADQAAQRGAVAVANVKDFATGGGADEPEPPAAAPAPGVSAPQRASAPPQQKSSPAATPPPGTAMPASSAGSTGERSAR